MSYAPTLREFADAAMMLPMMLDDSPRRLYDDDVLRRQLLCFYADARLPIITLTMSDYFAVDDYAPLRC